MASEGEDEDVLPDGNPEMAEEGCLSRSVSPTSDASVIMSSCQSDTENSELSQFRHQWQKELLAKQQNVPAEDTLKASKEDDTDSVARELYLKGVAAERSGESYLAMVYYRQATKLVPDIEWRCSHAEPTTQQQQGLYSPATDAGDVTPSGAGTEAELVCLFRELKLEASCKPDTSTQGVHISHLPTDVLRLILTWVVSEDLDLWSLERFSAVCRGFYILARDDGLWMTICKRLLTGVGDVTCHGSWRQVYLSTPHPHFHGCYISRASYVRAGEQSLDGLYKPYHLVVYYRFLRFFPDGSVLYLMSPDDPAQCVPKLVHHQKVSNSVLSGYYRVNGNQLTVVVTRFRFQSADGTGRSRRNGKLSVSHEEIFQMEFVFKGSHGQKFSWVQYSCRCQHRATGDVAITDFDIDSKLTPYHFSPVKSYLRFTYRPLT